MTAEPVHRTILVLDIVEFTHPQRTDPARLRLREKLYELIHQTLTAAGEDPGHVPSVDLGRRRSEPLVLVVSGDIYRSVVWHEYPGIDRHAYRQLFRVRVAGRSHQGWVRGP
jgi:hypothetical protein